MSSPAFLESLNTRRTAVKLTGLPLIALSFQTLGQTNLWTKQTFYSNISLIYRYYLFGHRNVAIICLERYLAC